MIYLDNNATTRLAPEVFEAMRPFLEGSYGNPSSAYGLGRESRDAIETARGSVASDGNTTTSTSSRSNRPIAQPPVVTLEKALMTPEGG